MLSGLSVNPVTTRSFPMRTSACVEEHAHQQRGVVAAIDPVVIGGALDDDIERLECRRSKPVVSAHHEADVQSWLGEGPPRMFYLRRVEWR